MGQVAIVVEVFEWEFGAIERAHEQSRGWRAILFAGFEAVD